jgi:hypothetical protein
MSAKQILDRLSKYRAVGDNVWMACCPAHNDGSPSLKITELADERVLINCHAGCGALDVLTAVGLGWDAVMPPGEHYKSVDHRRSDKLDDFVVELAEDAKRHKRPLSQADKERYKLALKRGGRANGFAQNVREEASKPLPSDGLKDMDDREWVALMTEADYRLRNA